MDFDTGYAVKLFVASPSFVQVYFEAIANSIDAGATEIEITITTDGKIRNSDTLQIEIKDNGVGFTKERFDRFRCVREPVDAFHKGLGRLVYLKYFREVKVNSSYEEQEREFLFSSGYNGESAVSDRREDTPQSTTLSFSGFIGERIHSYDDLRPGSLKERIFEQFLPLLLNHKLGGNDVKISIELKRVGGDDNKELFPDRQELSVSDLPEFEEMEIKDPAIDCFDAIHLVYSIQKEVSRSKVITAVAVDGRTIPLNIIRQNSIPAGSSAIFILQSELFKGRADASRQKLILPDDVSETTLWRIVREKISQLLSSSLPKIAQKNIETRTEFEKKYPHLIGLFENDSIGIIDKNEAIETAQKQFFRQQRDVLEGDPENEELFDKSLELSARALAEYVLYRNWVIAKLNVTDKKNLESEIHNLIVPQHVVLDGKDLVEDIYRNNAWVLDDKFMTYRTILSEKTMEDVVSAITGDESGNGEAGRPDISMIFSADPNGDEKVDVVVVELKRREVEDKDASFAAVQLVQRAQKLVDYCPNIQRVWYYGIVDINENFSRTLRNMKWTPLFSKGNVFYQEYFVENQTTGEQVPTPITFLDFEAMTGDAAARNFTFLELLKTRFKQAIEQEMDREEEE